MFNSALDRGSKKMMHPKVLIIEDQQVVIDAICLSLEIRLPNWMIFQSSLGDQGIYLVEKENPDVVILDLGLPDISGFSVIKQIRLFSDVPILVLTISNDESSVVKALGLGADEYVVKPFRPMELTSRLETLTKRKMIVGANLIRCGNTLLDSKSKIIRVKNKIIDLTTTETLILSCLFRNIDKTVHVTNISQFVWGADCTKRVKGYISRLRRKIEIDPAHPHHILTHGRAGYSWMK